MIVQEAPMLHYTGSGPVSQQRSELLAALMGMQAPPPGQPNYSGAMPNAVELNRLYQLNKNRPMGLGAGYPWQNVGSSNNIPGTGFGGTAIGGTSWAQGAAPGPNQIEPM